MRPVDNTTYFLNIEECSDVINQANECYLNHPFRKHLGACDRISTEMQKCMMEQRRLRQEKNFHEAVARERSKRSKEKKNKSRPPNMAEENRRLYELTKQLAALRDLHNKQQKFKKMKLKLEVSDMIRECFKTFNRVVEKPPTFCDNAVEKQTTEESHLVIERKNGPYLQDLKEKVDELLVAELLEIRETKLPEDLEQGLQDLRTEIQEEKDQVKLYTCLANNFGIILENNLSNQISIDNNIFGGNKTEKMRF